MRIAYFTETYFPQINGVTYTIDAWREELQARDHEVHVVYPDSAHQPRRGEHPVASVETRVVEGYRLGAAFPREVADRVGDVDVVHGHGPFSLGVLGQRVAKRQDVPFVATHHTPLYRYFDYLSGQPELHAALYYVYKGWERLFYRSCDAALAPSQYTADKLAGRIAREITPLSNGLDTNFFAPSEPALRAEHGLEDDRVVGFCGRLGHEKNLDELLDFADRFDGHVLVAGDGFARDHYEPRFQAHPSITYVGRLPRERMPQFYSSLDAFLIPSTVETQGVSVLEANACGVPAVGADAMALSETIVDGENGKHYTPGDVDELAAAVEEVYEDLDRFQERSRMLAEQHSITSVVDDLLDIYHHLQESPR
ncbi:MAG: glycosyltransferase [Candidatus Nanohaloarchaea archaeon]|nr:glycosyltransferase [Candidatus Nanohaloarchaea archaeon]